MWVDTGGHPKSFRKVATGWLKTCVLIWAALFLCRKAGIIFRMPAPICAWRFVATNGWNWGWTDTHSSQHFMIMYLNEREEFSLQSESLPYVRMFSFETYSLWGSLQGILRDVEVIPTKGPNVFSNLTAAMNGESQGSYMIHITAQGGQNYTNELRALAPGRKSGFFVLAFRLYDVGDVPHPRAPWARMVKGGEEQPQRWGWVPPPSLHVRRVSAKKSGRKGKWREIEQCESTPHHDHPLIDRIQDYMPSLRTYAGFIKPNRKNNMHLQHASLFTSPDTRALGSAADVSAIGAADEEGDLWARITAKLPRTPRSLYSAPFIANTSAYDVRYVSFTSASRAFPLRAYSTLTDKLIRQHYQNKFRNNPDGWDGRYIVWIGPEGSEIPDQARREGALVMNWGEKRSREEFESIDFPAIIYNQVLSRSQASLSTYDEPAHHAAIADIVPHECPKTPTPSTMGKGQGRQSHLRTSPDEKEHKRESICCGANPPSFCHMPEFLHLQMREFYPTINFYLSDEDWTGAQVVKKLNV